MQIEIRISYKGKIYDDKRIISDLELSKMIIPFLYCWDILMLMCRDINLGKILIEGRIK